MHSGGWTSRAHPMVVVTRATLDRLPTGIVALPTTSRTSGSTPCVTCMVQRAWDDSPGWSTPREQPGDPFAALKLQPGLPLTHSMASVQSGLHSWGATGQRRRSVRSIEPVLVSVATYVTWPPTVVVGADAVTVTVRGSSMVSAAGSPTYAPPAQVHVTV